MNTIKTVVRLEEFSVTYRQEKTSRPSVDNLSLVLHEGQCLTLLGESGSGKTSIARAITGLLPPSASVSGRLYLEQQSFDLSDRSQNWQLLRGRSVGMISQDALLSLNPMRPVVEHFREALLFHGLCEPQNVTSVASDLLAFLNFSDPQRVLDSRSFELSGGMAQRVCIALALCLRPRVLIADEATAALDVTSRDEVFSLLRKCQSQLGLSLLFITHDLAVATAMAQHIMVLRLGRIEDYGSKDQVMKTPQSPYTKSLLKAQEERPCCAPFSQKTVSKKPLLDVRQACKSYDSCGKVVLQNVSLSLREEEILGLCGESGCGKSTLARCVMGLEPWDSGRILFEDTDLTHLKRHQWTGMYGQMQMVFQDARGCLNPGRSVKQLLLEPSRNLKVRGILSEESQIADCLAEVGLPSTLLSRRPPELSTGQCQRVAIARALSVSPRLLICDEAVSALDTLSTNRILHLLLRLHRSRGLSIVMISHDFQMLRRFCHRVTVMKQGRLCNLVESGDVQTPENHLACAHKKAVNDVGVL